MRNLYLSCIVLINESLRTVLLREWYVHRMLYFALAAFILAAAGCGSDETITGEDPVAEIDGLRVELPCLGPGNAGVNCDMPDADDESTTIVGEPGKEYVVTIRVRGVVEQKTYSDYYESDGMWIAGGTPDGGSWNIFRLEVSSPAQTYYLNSGASGYDECFALDVQKTILMTHGATLTLFAGSGGDNLGTINMDDMGEPIVISGVSPYPSAFDGQFVQLDIVDVDID